MNVHCGGGPLTIPAFGLPGSGEVSKEWNARRKQVGNILYHGGQGTIVPPAQPWFKCFGLF
jgi:hypothetical protein